MLKKQFCQDGWQYEFPATLEVTDCPGCGIHFAAPAEWLDRKRANGGSFRCPNSDCPWPSQSYTDPREERLKKKLKATEQSKRYWENEAELNERLRRAQKAQTTIARNKIRRAEAGVCPHCKRNFKQLRRHMEAKHSA